MLIIRRVLYGLKSSGASFRSHFAQTMKELGFFPCLADNDVWMKPATKKDGTEYYEYVLTYVDDCLVISGNPDWIIKTLQEAPYEYRLKDVGPPEHYVGAKIGKYDIKGEECWYMSAELYFKKAIEVVEHKWTNLTKMFSKPSLENKYA